MLTAKKNRILEKCFAFYNRNLFKRRFHSMRVAGLQNLLGKKDDLPFIIYANHSSWWDGLAAFNLTRAAELDFYVMMEERQLKQLFLFRYLGAFSVVRENPREAVRSINYASSLLKNKQNRCFWIFPQGKILPADQRPIEFYNGISRVVEKVENCKTVAVAFRYEFTGEFKPEIFVKIDQPQKIEWQPGATTKAFTKKLENNLTNLLDSLNCDVAGTDFSKYENLF